MTKATNKLSDTARAMLTLAATREDRLVRPPPLPAAARLQVVRSLLNNGLVEEIPAPIDDGAYAWRAGDDGTALMLRATDTGLAAAGVTPVAAEPPQTIEAFTRVVIGFLAEEGCNATILDEAEAQIMVEDGFASGRPAERVAGDILAWLAETEDEADDTDEAEAAAAPTDPGTQATATADDDAVAREAKAVADALETAPTAPARATLRHAAEAVLAAWNDETNRATDIIDALEEPMAALRAALGERTARRAMAATRDPRTGTKQEAVLTMLRRDEGATVAQIAEATAWQTHTVRGFLAGLKKKGIKVASLERVRQVGVGKEGAKGSFSIYQVRD